VFGGLIESVVFAYLMRVNMTVVATNIVEVLCCNYNRLTSKQEYNFSQTEKGMILSGFFFGCKLCSV
jgi:hypothetical protein